MRLRYEVISDWPPLAWLARCSKTSDSITVLTGPAVERSDDWFCEAAWAGTFSDGDFDQTDIIFGTGARVRSESIVFVSSTAAVDRLQYLDTESEVLVSNSLVCLCACGGVELDPSYPEHETNFRSVWLGLRRYEGKVRTRPEVVQLVYVQNIVWDGRSLQRVDKPYPSRDFSNFQNYRNFLDASLAAIIDSLSAPGRKHPFGLLSMLSAGYDSTAIASLISQYEGLRTFGFSHSRQGDFDSGAPVAQALGLPFTQIGTDDWRSARLAEVPFLSTGLGLGGDVVLAGADELLGGNAVFAGHYGDTVWEKYPQAADIPCDNFEFVPVHGGGASVTEYRLRKNFLHCVIPVLGIRQAHDIIAITQSEEMSPWDTGNEYSRPICRRIAEEAGVPRQAFGQNKTTAVQTLLTGTASLTADSQQAYVGWLKKHRKEWLKDFRLPPFLSVHRLLTNVHRTGSNWMKNHPRGETPTLPYQAVAWLARLLPRYRFYSYISAWAVECAARDYRTEEFERAVEGQKKTPHKAGFLSSQAEKGLSAGC